MAIQIVIEKGARVLTACEAGHILLRAKIALGSCPDGRKEREGDGRTPEGKYTVCTRNPQSKYHLSLGLSYPNAEDADRGYAARVITRTDRDAIAAAISQGRRPPWDTALGGFIMIPGGGASRDWTAGCVALEDADMDALWDISPIGTEVEIRP